MNILKILSSSGTLKMLGFDSVSTHIKFLSELADNWRTKYWQNIDYEFIQKFHRDGISFTRITVI